MSIPSKWWIYILPGFIVIASTTVGVLGINGVKELYQPDHFFELASSAIIAGLSYIVGYSMNVVLVELGGMFLRMTKIIAVRPRQDVMVRMRFEHSASAGLVRLAQDGHERLTFDRCLATSFVILGVNVLCSSDLTMCCKMISIVMIIIILASLISRYIKLRAEYHEHEANIPVFVSELVSGQRSE